LLIYLMQHEGISASALEDLLYTKSGLLGVSGVASDMRQLEASTDTRAAEAIELFVFRAAREIAALATSLGGLDMLVFTAGIGENSARSREAICAHLAWFGLAIDVEANAMHRDVISAPTSVVEVRVVATDEESMIARHTELARRNCTVGISGITA
jgi:acetate kinase